VLFVLNSFSGFDKLRAEYFLPSTDDMTVSGASVAASSASQASYVHTRTKQEVKSSEKLLFSFANMPDLWAK